MAKNLSNGKMGEDLASEYLEKNNYAILFRNYRYKKSEIDIIAIKDNFLIFVEVKFRSNLKFGNPEDFVTFKKQELIMAAAEYYTFDKHWNGNIRFDIISISKTNKEIAHFIDAF